MAPDMSYVWRVPFDDIWAFSLHLSFGPSAMVCNCVCVRVVARGPGPALCPVCDVNVCSDRTLGSAACP